MIQFLQKTYGSVLQTHTPRILTSPHGPVRGISRLCAEASARHLHPPSASRSANGPRNPTLRPTPTFLLPRHQLPRQLRYPFMLPFSYFAACIRAFRTFRVLRCLCTPTHCCITASLSSRPPPLSVSLSHLHPLSIVHPRHFMRSYIHNGCIRTYQCSLSAPLLSICPSFARLRFVCIHTQGVFPCTKRFL
jgi:hypothetical protein